MRLLYVANPVLGVPTSEITKLVPTGFRCVTPEDLGIPRIPVRHGGDSTLNATEVAKAYRAYAPVLVCESNFFIRGKRANPDVVQDVWDQPAGFDDVFVFFLSNMGACQTVQSCRPLTVRSREESRRDNAFQVGALWCVPRLSVREKGKGTEQLKRLLAVLGESAPTKSALVS